MNAYKIMVTSYRPTSVKIGTVCLICFCENEARALEIAKVYVQDFEALVNGIFKIDRLDTTKELCTFCGIV